MLISTSVLTLIRWPRGIHKAEDTKQYTNLLISLNSQEGGEGNHQSQLPFLLALLKVYQGFSASKKMLSVAATLPRPSQLPAFREGKDIVTNS